MVLQAKQQQSFVDAENAKKLLSCESSVKQSPVACAVLAPHAESQVTQENGCTSALKEESACQPVTSTNNDIVDGQTSVTQAITQPAKIEAAVAEEEASVVEM
jgi:hypothetical protein